MVAEWCGKFTNVLPYFVAIHVLITLPTKIDLELSSLAVSNSSLVFCLFILSFIDSASVQMPC